jgi:endo-1,4-beta-xylanase
VYTFKNVAANRCVDVVGPSTANGTRIHLWDCNNQNNQKFAAQ